MIGHYWAAVYGNIAAMPMQALIAAAAGLVLRRPLRRAWRSAVGEKADMEDVRRMASAAHKIAADLFEHQTGERHHAAPERESEGP